MDTKAPLASIYPASVLDTLVGSVDTISRWGIEQGQGRLVGAILGELPVAKAVNAMTSGQASPEKAAQECQDQVEDIQKSIK